MLRVALSGCGAVSRLYYAPALSSLAHEGLIALTGAFDPDEASAKAMAARTYGSFDELLADAPDLVIIASPPRFHADQATAALRAGVAVHCEKPLALSAADGLRIFEAAQTSGSALTVGLMRRAFPAARAIGELLKRQAIGPLRSIEIFEGGPFRWPVSSPRYFSREESGGGVLRDIGPHVLDLLTGWLGEPELVAYRDDAEGGVEANCLIELRCGGAPCSVRLSRDWERPNRHVFAGEHGRISWVPYEPRELEVSLGDLPPGRLDLPSPSNPDIPGEFEQAFAAALRETIARHAEGAVEVTRRSVSLDTLELIDRCYERRQPMNQPWRADDGPAQTRLAS